VKDTTGVLPAVPLCTFVMFTATPVSRLEARRHVGTLYGSVKIKFA